MSQKTVLIVDDDQTLVAPLKEGLEALGYRVPVAYDGLQGVLQAHQSHPDVIILDLNMPGGGGLSVYERLRATPDTREVPIIFSTVAALEELKARIKPTPRTYFLKKPVGLNQVIAVLNKVLGKSALPAAEVPFSPLPAPAQAPAPRAPAGRRAASARPKVHEFDVRVTYADTDKMGIIYYANYLRYFELGRTELMRSLGVRYRDLEVQRKLFIPVVDVRCQYFAPARYDDLLTVRTWIAELGKASIAFRYEIINRDLVGRRVALGSTRHALLNDLWRSVRAPEDLVKLLEPYVSREEDGSRR